MMREEAANIARCCTGLREKWDEDGERRGKWQPIALIIQGRLWEGDASFVDVIVSVSSSERERAWSLFRSR